MMATSVIAADVMTSPVITTHPNATLAEVAALLIAKRVSAVPVCTDDGRLAGIISEADLVKPFRESARRKRERWLDMLAEGGMLSEVFIDGINQNQRPAGELMSRCTITATRYATVAELAELMISHGIKRIPIVEDGKPIGIVSRSDLLRAIAQGGDGRRSAAVSVNSLPALGSAQG
jgi:CBS domain-containing protein